MCSSLHVLRAQCSYREIKIRYKAPVPTGSVVTVIGEVVGERRRLVDAKGWVELDGKIMAEAEVVMYRTAQLLKT